MKKLLVTVITVVYNDVSHIEQTMLSVLNQSYPYIEYIIIDGGSTDGTVDVIKKYADRLAYWVSEPDEGIYDAMNKGLEHATGDWVNFMNSGDAFASIDTIARVFAIEGVDYSSLKMIGGGTNNVYQDSSKSFYDPAKSATVIPYAIPFSHQACFTRTEVCRFDSTFKIAADYKVMYDVYHQYGTNAILSLDFPVANYAKDDSLSTNNQHKAKGEYLKIQSKHKNMRWWKEYIKWRFL